MFLDSIYGCWPPAACEAAVRKIPSHAIPMGIELEFACDAEALAEAPDLPNWRAKQDATIFAPHPHLVQAEFISKPGSLAQQRRNLQQVYEVLANVPHSANNSCGVHIHVDKYRIGDLVLQNLQQFIYSRQNFQSLIAFAGRYAPHTATLSSPAGHERGPRYTGLNTQNAATIEFRIFKATTQLPQVLAYAEFVEALIRFCGRPNARADLSWITFTGWAKRHSKKYPQLTRRMLDLETGSA